MFVVFIHGPAAAGKHTIAQALSSRTGLPLFHNHLAVDAALSLFEFGSPGFKAMREAIWKTAFSEAAAAGRSFIFTFHPEASVAPDLIQSLQDSITTTGGSVWYVALSCSRQTILDRIGNDSRRKFGKLTDANFYLALEQQGAFAFPDLPSPWLQIDTEQVDPDTAAASIESALRNENLTLSRGSRIGAPTG